jgi:protein-disulfide isomerase
MAHLEPGVTKADHIQGEREARLTLVEFGDYECPYCGEAYGVIKNVQAEMGPSLRFVFRNFPLKESHPHALAAALAAEAAGQQSHFWQMHDILFENQNALTPNDLARYAKRIGLDLRRFQADFEDEKCMAKVTSDFRAGVRSGVNGTPSFYIDGEKFEEDYMHGGLLRALKNGRPQSLSQHAP